MGDHLGRHRVPLVIIPVLIAVILAAAISPLVRWLTGRSWPRALAVVASFVAILAVVGGIITGIVILVSNQWAELSARAAAGVDQLHSFLNNGPVPVSDQQITAAMDSVREFFTSSSFGAEALTGARTVGEIFTGAVLMAVTLFFFLKDGPEIRTFLIGFLPADHRAKARLAADRSTVVLGGYVRGTAIVAAIDGLVVGITLAIMGVPLALPLGVFIFLGGFIPIVGATVAGTLAIAVALISNGPIQALIVLAVVIGGEPARTPLPAAGPDGQSPQHPRTGHPARPGRRHHARRHRRRAAGRADHRRRLDRPQDVVRQGSAARA